MTERDYNRETEELIGIVNGHHQEVLENENKKNDSIKERKNKILSKLSISGRKEKTTKKIVLQFSWNNNEKFATKNPDGELVGTINVSQNVKSKIILSGTKPVFVIYKDNEIYMQKDVMTGQYKGNVKGVDKFTDTMKAHEQSMPMINFTKYIYELIDNKNYDLVGAYINSCMEKLINANVVESSPKTLHDIYIKAQVLMRNIYNTQSKINDCINKNQNYSEYIIQLDVLYRQICEIFINAGFYEVLEPDGVKITRG